jgi:hypothetical protein
MTSIGVIWCMFGCSHRHAVFARTDSNSEQTSNFKCRLSLQSITHRTNEVSVRFFDDPRRREAERGRDGAVLWPILPKPRSHPPPQSSCAHHKLARLFALNAAMNFDQRAKPRHCTLGYPSVLAVQFLRRPHIAAASMENRKEYPAPERRSETPPKHLHIPATLRLPLLGPSRAPKPMPCAFSYCTSLVDRLLKRNASCTSLGGSSERKSILNHLPARSAR